MAEDGAGDGGGSEETRRASPEAAKLLKAAARGDASAVVAIFEALDPARAVGGAGALRARGTTALHEAAKGGHTIIVEELLRRRTEVDVLNKSGCSSLHFAVLCKEKQKALDVANCLLEARASANTESERLDTPLHFASYCEGKALSEDVVKLLLECRAQVNRLNRSSESALHNAVLNSNLESARVLLDARADAAQKSSLGKTAADIATDRNSQEILELLVASAARREEGACAGDVALVRGVSRQMSEARALATAAERLRGEVLRRTGHAQAYESAAAVVLEGLSAPARAAIAERSVDAVRCIQAEAGGSEDACGRPVPLEPLFQALATMALVARCEDGANVLVAGGLAEILPFVEAQVGELQAGEHEVLELRAALGRASRRLSEHRSRTGTPETTLGVLEESPALTPAGPGPVRAPISPAPKRPTRPPGPQVLSAWGSGPRPAGPKGDPGLGKADSKSDAKAGYPVT